MGPAIGKGSFKSNYIQSYSTGHGEYENVCFVCVVQMVSVLPAFVYNAVEVNKMSLFL